MGKIPRSYISVDQSMTGQLMSRLNHEKIIIILYRVTFASTDSDRASELRPPVVRGLFKHEDEVLLSGVGGNQDFFLLFGTIIIILKLELKSGN